MMDTAASALAVTHAEIETRASEVEFVFCPSCHQDDIGAATGHPGVCAHIAVIPLRSTAEITSTLSGHGKERLMTRIYSLLS